MKDYGTNNSLAYLEGECPLPNNVKHKHVWKETRLLGRCYHQYECECGAVHRVDSSD